mgnify:CR=1 FL=1
MVKINLANSMNKNCKELSLGHYGIVTSGLEETIGKFVLKSVNNTLIFYGPDGFTWASTTGSTQYYYRKLLPTESVTFTGE